MNHTTITPGRCGLLGVTFWGRGVIGWRREQKGGEGAAGAKRRDGAKRRHGGDGGYKRNTRKPKVYAYIAQLPLTPEQKDSLVHVASGSYNLKGTPW